MFEQIIILSLYACVLAIIVLFVIWIIEQISGIPIPPKIIQLTWVIVALIIILMVYKTIGPSIHLPKLP